MKREPGTESTKPPASRPLEQETDGTLMQLYQQGQLAGIKTVGAVDAFDELYRRHSPRAYGYLRPRTSSRQEADDLLQACFLKLHQSRHQFDPAQPFLPWFWSILRSVHADELRRHQRNPARANASEDDARARWESIPADHAAAAPEKPASGEAAELFQALSEEQRRLLELRTERELSFEEIARELSITPATARQRFSRLVKTLKARLSGADASVGANPRGKGAQHE